MNINDYKWAHSIDLGQGVITPGLWSAESQSHIMRLMDKVDYRSKTVLDVGTLDGKWAFEAEKRGASVVAIDMHLVPTFDAAKAILQSKVERFQMLVEHCSDLGRRVFDVVQFFGVYYHMKNPLLGFEELYKIMRPKGTLLVEGEITDEPGSFARFYKGEYKDDSSNWWVPTPECVGDWMEASGFKPELPGEVYCSRYAMKGIKNVA